MAKKKLDFEQSMERLEVITELIEAGEMPLEKTLVLYKEAMDLAAFCAENLNAAEKEITLLQKNALGAFERKAFDIN